MRTEKEEVFHMEQTGSLGKRIAQLRKQNGFTQEQLAERVGVSAQAVSKWENDISCPDITTLPLLADIFHVSVDELLGVKPVEPHVVIVEKEKKKEEKKGKAAFSFEFEADSEKERHGFFIGGIITLLLILSVLLLQRMTPLFQGDFSTWNYIWPLLVFGVGLCGLIEWNRPVPIFSIGLVLVGAYEFVWFLLDKPDYLFELDWLIVLIVLAILLLINAFIQKFWVHKKVRSCRKKYAKKANGIHVEEISEYKEEGDELFAKMRFTDDTYVYASNRLVSADIDVSFSDCVFDLGNVQEFADDTVLNVRVSFGSVTLILPQNVVLHTKGTASFGARSVHGSPHGETLQPIYLESSVSFGSLDIRYPNA